MTATSSISTDLPEQSSSPSKIYSKSFRVLHWLMGIGFSLLLIAGQQFNLAISDEYRISGLKFHSSIGTIVLISAFCLLVKRFIFREQRPSSGLTGFQLLGAHLAQLALYFLAVFIPLSGIATAYYSELPTMLFGVFDLAQGGYHEQQYLRIRNLHELGTFAGLALVAMHAGAALYHHFIVKDNVLKSMLLWKAKK